MHYYIVKYVFRRILSEVEAIIIFKETLFYYSLFFYPHSPRMIQMIPQRGLGCDRKQQQGRVRVGGWWLVGCLSPAAGCYRISCTSCATRVLIPPLGNLLSDFDVMVYLLMLSFSFCYQSPLTISTAA